MSVNRFVLIRASYNFYPARAAPFSRCAVQAQSRKHSTTSWNGLDDWRSFVDRRRGIGPKGITEEVIPEWESSAGDIVLPRTLAECAVAALNTADPCIKAAVTHRIFLDICSSNDVVTGHAAAPECTFKTVRLCL